MLQQEAGLGKSLNDARTCRPKVPDTLLSRGVYGVKVLVVVVVYD